MIWEFGTILILWAGIMVYGAGIQSQKDGTNWYMIIGCIFVPFIPIIAKLMRVL